MTVRQQDFLTVDPSLPEFAKVRVPLFWLVAKCLSESLMH